MLKNAVITINRTLIVLMAASVMFAVAMVMLYSNNTQHNLETHQLIEQLSSVDIVENQQLEVASR